MSKVEAVKLPEVTPETLALVRALVQEMNAPSAEDVRTAEIETQQRKEMAQIAARQEAARRSTQEICPHRQNQNRSVKTALCLVEQRDPKDNFIICQTCSKVVKTTDVKWNEYFILALSAGSE